MMLISSGLSRALKTPDFNRLFDKKFQKSNSNFIELLRKRKFKNKRKKNLNFHLIGGNFNRKKISDLCLRFQLKREIKFLKIGERVEIMKRTKNTNLKRL